jgi:uncharacterized protein with HEPN domain
MPSDRARQWFADIVRAVDLIQSWTRDAGGADAVMANEMSRSAVERQLLIISEAAIRLSHAEDDIASKLAPEIDWPGVRGMGNVLRHRYDDMDFEIVVDVLANGLTPLRLGCEAALRKLSGEQT